MMERKQLSVTHRSSCGHVSSASSWTGLAPGTPPPQGPLVTRDKRALCLTQAPCPLRASVTGLLFALRSTDDNGLRCRSPQPLAKRVMTGVRPSDRTV